MGVYNCSLFCCMLLYVHSSIAIILMGKRELVALLNLSSWCLVMVEWFFLTVPQGCLQFVIVVFPNHTHLLLFRHTLITYYVKKMLEHRYDIRIWESCVDPNLLMVVRQDPDNFTCVQTRERCALEIATYVFKGVPKTLGVKIYISQKSINFLHAFENAC